MKALGTLAAAVAAAVISTGCTVPLYPHQPGTGGGTVAVAPPPVPAGPTPNPAGQLETFAFCGVHPAMPDAARQVQQLAAAGIDAAMGPCLPPDWSTYTVAEPGARYATPEVYRQVLDLHAAGGIATIVYDARIWSTDPAVRQAAIDFWWPVRQWIRAWDLGDEADPTSPDWGILIARQQIILDHVVPVIGIGGYTNHLYFAVDEAVAEFPAASTHLSFDAYGEENGVMTVSLAITREYAPKVNHLMVAINALPHAHYQPTASSIRRHMVEHCQAGADSFLIFGGSYPVLADGVTPDPYFGGRSLTTDPTWVAAVKAGSECR